MAKNIKDQAKESFFWTALFQVFEFVLRFGSSIVLARILFPEDFGLMGLTSIAIQFARRLTNFGLTSVLVQLKEIKDDHYHTVFWMNFGLLTVVAGIVYFSAPFYAGFFGEPQLLPIMQLIAFDFILKSFASVPQSILRRNMKFKEANMAHTIGKMTMIITTIILAVMGYGVWSLVFGTLAGSFLQRAAVIRFALKVSDWRPRFRFKMWALKDTFSFGAWLYINAFVGYGINKVDYFFIGKFMGAAQLGFYERAFDLMSLPRKRLVRKINTVAFATYSRIQDDGERLIRGLLRVTSYLSIVTYPLMIWLFFAAPAFIILLYGEKWAFSILPLQIMCVSGLVDSFTLIFHPLLKARGLIGNSVRRDMIYLTILTACVLGSIFYIGGIEGVAWGIVVASFIRLSLMVSLTIRHLPLSLWKFVLAQKSAMVYGGFQIGVLYLFQEGAKPYFAVESLNMLVSVSALSLLTVFGSHMIIRFKDVDNVFQEFFGDLKKFSRKLPVLKRLSFLHGK